MEFSFSIDVFTPETLPQKRLAQYLAQISVIYGNTENVHFVSLKKGSAVLVSYVDEPAVTKVRERITAIAEGTAPADALKAWDETNRMLRSDNASGILKESSGVTILDFPGKKLPLPEFTGRITQNATFEGLIVGVTGMDSSKHIHIEVAEGQKISGECSEYLARELKNFLYEPQPLRLHGQARYSRLEDGTWQMHHFSIKGYEHISDRPLTEVMDQLHQLHHEAWQHQGDEAWSLLLENRQGEESRP